MVVPEIVIRGSKLDLLLFWGFLLYKLVPLLLLNWRLRDHHPLLGSSFFSVLKLIIRITLLVLIFHKLKLRNRPVYRRSGNYLLPPCFVISLYKFHSFLIKSHPFVN